MISVFWNDYDRASDILLLTTKLGDDNLKTVLNKEQK